MRTWIVLLLALSLPAQEKKETAEQAAPETPKENAWSGSVDFGFRAIPGVGGSYQTYRSVTNLQEGVRLFGAEVNYKQAGGALLDTLHLSAYNLGDPYNSARLDAGKQGLWRWRANYSNVAYYNLLPSFANVTPGKGGFNERAYDVRNRLFDSEVEVLPGKTIAPFFGYSYNQYFGSGIAPYFAAQNEYTVPTAIAFHQNTYRYGARINADQWHLTLEQGGTRFSDDQYAGATQSSTGHRTTPYWGRTLRLNSLQQYYTTRGTSNTTRALLTASPVRWLSLSGQFYYSAPKTVSKYQENLTGTLAELGSLLVYDRQAGLVNGDARMPHPAGNITAEIRITAKARLVETFSSDRMHNTAAAFTTAQNGNAATTTSTLVYDATELVSKINQHQGEFFYDFSRRVTARGGYRYEWGDAQVRSGKLNIFGPAENRNWNRRVVLGGLTVRPVSKLYIAGDVEGATTEKTYFRTGMRNYYRLRTRARYDAGFGLLLNAGYNRTDNTNPLPGINYNFKADQITAGAQWMPPKAKQFNILADYTRAVLRSDIRYLQPFPAVWQRSLYTEQAHTATAVLNWMPAVSGRVHPTFTIGGSTYFSTGSRPSRFHQPLGRVVLPLNDKLQIYSEWRYYALSQPYAYAYEGYRTTHFVTGARWSF